MCYGKICVWPNNKVCMKIHVICFSCYFKVFVMSPQAYPSSEKRLRTDQRNLIYPLNPVWYSLTHYTWLVAI